MKRGLAGPLSAEKLVEVLRLLEENQYYGTVLLSDGLREKCFFFTRGGLRLASSSCGSLSLPDYLLLRGAMSASQRAEHRLEARRYAGEVSQRALLARQLSREGSALEEDERSSLISEFMGALFWRGACFEYRPVDPEEEAYQAQLSTRLLSIGIKRLVTALIDRLLRSRELRRRIPGWRARFELTEAGRRVEGGSDAEGLVLAQLGSSAPSSLGELSGRLPGECAYEAALALSGLLDRGFVTQLGELSVEREETVARIIAMERGVDQAISPIMRRQALARAYEGGRDVPAAARHFKRAGFLLLASERSGEAAEDLRRAHELTPEDFEAQEGLIDALWAARQNKQAARESEALARRYLDLGLYNRARLSLERARARGASTLGLKELLVRAYLRLKLKDKALELGREVCEELRADQRHGEAHALTERFLAEGVEQGRTLRMTGERRRRRLWWAGMVANLGFALVLAVSLAALQQRRALALASEDALVGLREGRYVVARARFAEQTSGDRLGFESAARDARLAQLDALIGERAELRARLGPWIRAGRLDWSKGPAVSAAKVSLERLQEAPADEPRGARFLEAVERCRASLDEHIEAAGALERLFSELCSKRRYRAANDCAKRFFASYGNVADSARRLRVRGVPVLLRSSPGGAGVVGARAAPGGRAMTDAVMFVKPAGVVLQLTLDGFVAFSVHLAPLVESFEPPAFRLEPSSATLPGEGGR